MKLTMVVVCHHSSDVLGSCVESFRRASKDAGLSNEVVVVEQSEDSDQRRAVEAAGAERVLVRPNRGYAAGLNAGIGCASGEILLLANPDLVFTVDSVSALVSGLDAGFDVVGPQLTWDRAGTVLFPPAENPAPVAELTRTLRRRWRPWWRLGLAPWIERLWRVWSADGPVEVPCLRGPLLVLSRDTSNRLGPLDEGYFLYYEETEWLWRARRRRARLGVVGDAKVVHHWGHSTGRRVDATEIEAVSRERFFRRNYPALWRWVLRRIDGGTSTAGISGPEVAGCADVPETEADLWLVSSFRHLQPAIGCLRRSRLPDRVAEVADRGEWHALAVTRTERGWRIAGAWTWGRP
jgi:GT2 family glycosyltransferase